MNKLHSERGETLIEVLASIVIGSLSVALMFSCIMAATDMDKKAKAADVQHYLGLTAVDARDAAPASNDQEESGDSEDSDDLDESIASTKPGRVTIQRDGDTGSPMPLDITIYEGAGMYFYSRSDSAEGVGDSNDDYENPDDEGVDP